VTVPDLPAVQNLLASWWFDYDRGAFDTFPGYFAADSRFSCRSDSGATAFEEFVTADVDGRDDVVAWQTAHRRASPFPLRHNATNVHVVTVRPGEADFRSYLFVTQVVAGAVSNLASGRCLGTVREEEGALRIADLQVVLDFTDSVIFDDALID
jgi:hypothetical protein